MQSLLVQGALKGDQVTSVIGDWNYRNRQQHSALSPPITAFPAQNSHTNNQDNNGDNNQGRIRIPGRNVCDILRKTEDTQWPKDCFKIPDHPCYKNLKIHLGGTGQSLGAQSEPISREIGSMRLSAFRPHFKFQHRLKVQQRVLSHYIYQAEQRARGSQGLSIYLRTCFQRF